MEKEEKKRDRKKKNRVRMKVERPRVTRERWTLKKASKLGADPSRRESRLVRTFNYLVVKKRSREGRKKRDGGRWKSGQKKENDRRNSRQNVETRVGARVCRTDLSNHSKQHPKKNGILSNILFPNEPAISTLSSARFFRLIKPKDSESPPVLTYINNGG